VDVMQAAKNGAGDHLPHRLGKGSAPGLQSERSMGPILLVVAHELGQHRSHLQQRYGAGHIWTRQATAQRAWSLTRLGRADEAIPLYEHAVAGERRLRGDTNWSQTLEQQPAWARRS
jgi:hypothetical protein